MENIGIHSNPADSRLRDIRAARSLDCLSGWGTNLVSRLPRLNTQATPKYRLTTRHARRRTLQKMTIGIMDSINPSNIKYKNKLWLETWPFRIEQITFFFFFFKFRKFLTGRKKIDIQRQCYRILYSHLVHFAILKLHAANHPSHRPISQSGCFLLHEMQTVEGLIEERYRAWKKNRARWILISSKT